MKETITLKLDWKQQIALTGALFAIMSEDNIEIKDEDKIDFEAWEKSGREEQFERLGNDIDDKQSNEDIGHTLNDIFANVAKAFLKTGGNE
ncbi:hypothetical protein MKX31_28125 [Bacillus sp. FSL M8-0063]|uniref:hypothetical protein n=1 Tax=Bacillus sp. FSL M8-0063 TaxID=2921566 RepID=UPI002E237FE4|nr:hypothetical protein [Bacillus thuringiensis]MED2829688.1 hypothetical protein [Bacillus thuringiensis]MED2856361.1 hypothetical protein [Bacillus thuringiensis]MED2863835.1 hypothetical protein [Bacillus thuringiensis]